VFRKTLKRAVISSARFARLLPHGVSLAADIKRRIPEFDIRLIFDVGANIGQAADEFLVQFPRSKIISFEPDPDAFLTLSARASSHSRLAAYNLGLGDRTERVRFDNSSPVSEIHAIAKDQSNERLPLVDMTTVDEFCALQGVDHIGLLKIDTEGNDLNVVAGSAGMLRRGKIDVVLAECSLTQISPRLVSFSELQTAMRSYGYVCFGIYQQAFGANPGDHQINWANCAYVQG